MVRFSARARTIVLMLVGAGAAGAAAAAADDALAPFRAAKDDETRFVVTVEPRDEESRSQVELLVGRVQRVDCNQQFFTGKLSRKTLLGRGHVYYSISDVGAAVSTRMACPDAATREAFVHLGGEPFLVPYSSRTPIVVYVPQGFEVRYRIWSADDQMLAAEPR